MFNGEANEAGFVKGLRLTYKKLLRELTFVVVEARIEACQLILDIQVSFFTSFLLRYQHRHRWTLYQSGFVTVTKTSGVFS
jgi:predicted membrane-bound dolichyl-phosphate-mannose-protein mannosyltransferase